MRNKIHTVALSVLSVIFLFTGMAFARTKNINVLYPATVGKMLTLKPGNYKIEVVNNNPKAPAVQFYNHDGKLVGEAPVKLVDKSHKNNQTLVDYYTIASNDHAITEISPSGWKEDLVFSQPTSGNLKPKN
ncbi:MAG TPA: hypothetical protein VFQ24_18550 [Terriglobia bacterium]|nr:hypothetical protein [Terriglobia bacterium]